MIKIKFNSAAEMVYWLMNNEGQTICDNYGREWRYSDFTFLYRDISENDLSPGIHCLHLFETDLYHTM